VHSTRRERRGQRETSLSKIEASIAYANRHGRCLVLFGNQCKGFSVIEWLLPVYRSVLALLTLVPMAAMGGETTASSPVQEKLIMGWLESVFLKPWNARATAKLDTGAKTSSLNAEQITHFTRDGREWVRFRVSGIEDSQPLSIERPLIRMAYIKERRAQASRRDVITLTLCKNGKDYETEFTLVDRSNFNYPVLLGRSFLEGVALVDPGATFLHKAENDPCKADAARQEKTDRSRRDSSR
jgi:hypothetical protein